MAKKYKRFNAAINLWLAIVLADFIARGEPDPLDQRVTLLERKYEKMATKQEQLQTALDSANAATTEMGAALAAFTSKFTSDNATLKQTLADEGITDADIAQVNDIAAKLQGDISTITPAEPAVPVVAADPAPETVSPIYVPSDSTVISAEPTAVEQAG